MIHEFYAPEISIYATAHCDDDGCRALLRSVIKQTMDDIRYLKSLDGSRPKKHERAKLLEIEECPPAEFLAGDWFVEICDYLELDASRLRQEMGVASARSHS